jgi:predicted Zn-dependent peptidase
MGQVEKTVLPGGVRLVSESQPHAYSVTLGLWMEVGSRDESPLQGGISHFIEHMAFKGTPGRSALDIAREIDRLGGLANAFTSKENTCFHARALTSHLPEMAGLLTDLALRPALDPQEMEREREVILQEIGSVEDTPDELVHVLFGQNYWPDHPLGRPVLGTVESVSALDRQAIQDYMGATYLPQATVVSAVGKLEHQRLLDLLGPALSELPQRPSALTRRPPTPRPGLHVYSRELEQAHLALGMPAPSATSNERFVAAILNLILGGNMSSRLFQEVRERRGLAYAVYSYLSAYSDSGMLGVYLGVAPGRAVEALTVVRAEMERLGAEPVAEHELSDAKESLKGSILLAAENPESRMSRLARNEFNFGRDVPVDEVVAQVEAVTAEDLERLAASMLDTAQLGVTVLGDVDEDSFRAELGW